MKDNFDQHKWFKNQYLSEGEIGSIKGDMSLDYSLEKYSLSEILDYISSWYGKEGENNAQSLTQKYAVDFREKGLI